jgi:Arc/MetJ-type ribon-helix-helix transcriptional regulator
MKKEKYKNVMISMPEGLWQDFKEDCQKQYKSASSVIRELIIDWSEKNGKKGESRGKA